MSHRGDPRLPTADQIERHGLKDWAHRLVLRLYDRFREIDDDVHDISEVDTTAIGALAGVAPAADTIPYFDSTTTATSTGLTAAARSLLDDTTTAAMLTTLGAQPSDAELSAIAGLTSAADRLPYFTGSGTAALATFTSTARSLLDDTTTAAMLTTLGAQPSDAELTAIAGLTSAADRLPYFTGSGTATLATFTSAARDLLDDASASAMRTTLGVDAALTTGSWTPTFTFATPGDLSVSYSTRTGKYTVLNNKVDLFFSIATSAFTHTTASGEARITGQPFASDDAEFYSGIIRFQGITKASYTQFYIDISIGSSNLIRLLASGSGVGMTTVNASDMPTGGTVVLIGRITYLK